MDYNQQLMNQQRMGMQTTARPIPSTTIATVITSNNMGPSSPHSTDKFSPNLSKPIPTLPGGGHVSSSNMNGPLISSPTSQLSNCPSPLLSPSSPSNGSPCNSPNTMKRARKNLEKQQVEILESAFAQERYPSKQAKEQLADQVGLSYTKVVKWFDNRRTKARKTYDGQDSLTSSPTISSHSMHLGGNGGNIHMMGSPSANGSSEGSPTIGRNSPGMMPIFPGNKVPLLQHAFSNMAAINNITNRMSTGLNFNNSNSNMSSLLGNTDTNDLSSSSSSEDIHMNKHHSIFSTNPINNNNASGSHSDRMYRRPLEESWESTKDHRMYAVDTTKSLSGLEVKQEANKNLVPWLEFIHNRKRRNKMQRRHNSQNSVNMVGTGNSASSFLDDNDLMVDDLDVGANYMAFKSEVLRLFALLDYQSQIFLWQGDNYWVSSNVTVTTFSFKLPRNRSGSLNPFHDLTVTDAGLLLPTSAEKDMISIKKEDLDHGSVDLSSPANPLSSLTSDDGAHVLFECLHDSRIVGRQSNNNQVASERLRLSVTTNHVNGLSDTMTLGAKAFGTCESLSAPDRVPGTQYDCWGDIERLKAILDTSLKPTELMAFLIFCTQFKSDQRWLRICMKYHMFNEDDTDYYGDN